MTGRLKLPISPEAQETIDQLLAAFEEGPSQGEEDGRAMKQLAHDIGWQIYKDQGGKCREEADRITNELLAKADLGPDLAYHEALLKRLADDPKRAYLYALQRRTSESTRNRAAARQPRRSNDDWWSGHIEDCLDDDPEAKPSDVKRYLLETGEVQVIDGKLHCTSHAALISEDALRSRIGTAKKRKNREG